MSRIKLTLLLFFSGFNLLYSQLSLGPELQVYPTGIIPGIRMEYHSDSSESYHLRIGYQWIRHRDLGVHDDERGEGIGFTIGYLRHLSTHWSLGIRNDFWWNSLNWTTENKGGNSTMGKTEIWVVQPTAILEYQVHINERFMFAPSISFGWEWNAKTEGEPTGEGAILLIGFSFQTRL